jgi:hypothetical protein
MGYTLLNYDDVASPTDVTYTNLTSDYDEYLFTFNAIKPVIDDGPCFMFQVDTGTNTAYDTTITSAQFSSGKNFTDSWNSFGNLTGTAVAQQDGDVFQQISQSGESDYLTYSWNKGSNHFKCVANGWLRLYAPSSGTFVKHFISQISQEYTGNGTQGQTYHITRYTQGYFNTTTALTRIRFKFFNPYSSSHGNISDGHFAQYGLS